MESTQTATQTAAQAVTAQVATTVERARQSGGASSNAIYAMVARAWERFGNGQTANGTANQADGATAMQQVAVDVGCGTGGLRGYLPPTVTRYVGVDLLRYDGFPADAEFCQTDLDQYRIDLPAASADITVSVETIEHLENPRAFFRELVRLTKPGGWVAVTTPNQLSLLSLASVVLKGRFAAFGPREYPAHITALLEIDLRRIATECGLAEIFVCYSLQGRIVFTPWPFPRFLARLFPRRLSDNLLLAGRKPL
jgi:2-polyprenyl-3-methyl-5-hydroxy-6-metoxy-1,4-benzoquinol methylase